MKFVVKIAARGLALCVLPLLALAQHAGNAPAHAGPARTDGRMQMLRPSPSPSTAQAPESQPTQRSLMQWLLRMHEASRNRAYAGTFVVSSAGGAMSSSRIWHVCEGDQQVERIDTLTGAPRSTFRHNDQVVTFFPASRLVQTERREALRGFPDLLATQDAAIAELYSARRIGSDRVAGLDADVVLVEPRDRLRFGYRIWSERETGLMIKMQTLDGDGRALEQAAFSELQLDARVNKEQLIEMMRNTQGYQVQKLEPVSTTANAEGWLLGPVAAGFHLTSCLRRPFAQTLAAAVLPGAKNPTQNTVQWTFSDGLASVSLFVEPMDKQQKAQEVQMTMGATGLLSRRIQDWWLTVVGEVPQQTLQVFSQSLQRAR